MVFSRSLLLIVISLWKVIFRLEERDMGSGMNYELCTGLVFPTADRGWEGVHWVLGVVEE